MRTPLLAHAADRTTPVCTPVEAMARPLGGLAARLAHR